MLTVLYPHFQPPFPEYNIAQAAVVPFLDQDVNLIVSFPTATGKCLEYNSRVLLADGSYLKIGKICEKENPVDVLSLNMNTLKIEKSTAYPVIKKSSDELLRIEIKKGNSVITTKEHPFLIKSNKGLAWVRADRIREGDYVATPRSIKNLKNRDEISLNMFLKGMRYGYVDDRALIRELLSSLDGSKRKTTKFLCQRLGLVPKTIQRWRYSGRMPIRYFYKASNLFDLKHGSVKIKGSSSAKSFVIPEGMCRDTAWLLGLILGNGTLSKTPQVRISGVEENVMNRVSYVLRNVFNTYCNEIYQGVDFGNKPLSSLFNAMGVPVGKKSDIIEVPDYILSAKDDIVAGFLSGFLDADGYVSKLGEVEFYSDSEDFIFGIQTLLLRFGVRSQKRERLVKRKRRYKCVISDKDDIIELRRHIDIYHAARKDRLNDIRPSQNTNDNIIPNASLELKKAKNELGLRDIDLDCSIQSVAEGSRKNISFKKASAFVEKYPNYSGAIAKIVNSDISFEKVISVKEHKGEEKVYDLTVEGNHNFIAENIVCHNTVLAEGAMAYHLQSDGRSKVAYVAPFRSLASERYEAWMKESQFKGYGVLLSTGDHAAKAKEFDEKRIALVTSESFDSKARGHTYSDWIKDLKLVIFDEAHLIGADVRGGAVECSIMRLLTINPSCRVILLSATMSNATELAKWIKSLNKKKTKCITSSWRPNKIVTRYHSCPERADDKVDRAIQVLNQNHEGGKTVIFVHSKYIGGEIVKRLRAAGVKSAFHNASIPSSERKKIEKAFSDSRSGLDIIVSTSTLGAGVNIG